MTFDNGTLMIDAAGNISAQIDGKWFDYVGECKDEPVPRTEPEPKLSSIGDYVWFDTDKNGLQNGGEQPAVGVTVKLLDKDGKITAATVTDNTGKYLFDKLQPGDYTVEFVAPEGHQFTAANTGDDTLDSDADLATGRSAVISLGEDMHVRTVDAGIVVKQVPPEPEPKLSSIGDYVWFDADKNGLQNGSEQPAAGVTVKLLDKDGKTVATTATDSTGKYLFDKLQPGDYTVEFVAPDGHVFTTANAQEDGFDTLDSDADLTTGRSSVISLGDNEHVRTVDAGIVVKTAPPEPTGTASIGDYVWFDTDKDGLQDRTEQAVAGVTVKLLDKDGKVIATTTTDASGKYLFDKLPKGDYTVEFVAPDGHVFTTANAQEDGLDTVDSDADLTTGRSGVISLGDNEHVRTVDAGLVKAAPPAPKLSSIGDYVWFDADKNGLQNGGEPSLAGVTVKLLDKDGETVATQQTDASGKYLFDQLQPGDYTVEFVAPDGHVFTAADAQDDGFEALDSDADLTTGRSAVISLGEDEHVRTVDAGFVKAPPPPPVLSSIGDYVWVDADLDGRQEAGEQAYAGLAVRLLDEDGNVVATTTTDQSGKYLFDELQPGQYRVEFDLPEGYTFTTANAVQDDLDSDADPSTGRSELITLGENEHIRTVDAGLCPPPPPPVLSSIGDYVWMDADKDGLQNSNEQAAAGVTVNLLDKDGRVVATQQTGADGKYLFDALQPGDYTVEFVAPEGYEFTAADAQNNGLDILDSDADAGTGRSGVISLGEDEHVRTVDAGLCLVPQTASLGDYVWLDTNKDGLQDADEQGVAGVTVTLIDQNGRGVATQQTDADGKYLFDDLDPGSYQVVFERPEGYTFTTRDAEANTQGARDSDADLATGRSGLIDLEAGDHIRTIDAGLIEQAGANPDSVKVCEDKQVTFDVLANDHGAGLKLVGVSHETATLQREFELRGGKLSFTEDGKVTYEGMTDYYGFDKLVYTMEDADGQTFTATVDIELTPASDAPTNTEGRTYHPSRWEEAFSDKTGARGTILTLEDFGTMSDDADKLQEFSDYNDGVAADTDRPEAIILTGVKNSSNTMIFYRGEELDFSNGQTHRIPLEDIEAGLLQLEHLPPYYTSHTYYWKVEDSGRSGGACDSQNVSTIKSSTVNTPIALDLNGDGRIGVTGETSSYQKDPEAELGRTVSFDIDGDGDLDTTEWFAGDGDGILVDLSKIGAAGEIDGKALFGDEGGRFANGYDKLKLADRDGDGMVAGEELDELGVWIDDGYARLEEGELKSAADAGIAAISTGMEIALDDQGRALMQSSAFDLNGQAILTEDVWFAAAPEDPAALQPDPLEHHQAA